MKIIKHKSIFFGITILTILFSIGAVSVFGLKLSIDFTGGALIEFSCEREECVKDSLIKELDNLSLGEYSLRNSGNNNFVLRTKAIDSDQRERLFSILEGADASVGGFSEVGPIIGNELKRKAVWAILLVVTAIVLFVAFAFRPEIVKREETPEGIVKITRDNHGVSSWIFGIVAILALIHDILIPVGIFAIMGYLWGAEVGVLFVMALLAILGYSVNDTIVVFDRIRERLKNNVRLGVKNENFEDTVGKALDDTIVRSINTSLTTLIMLLALYFLGPEVTKNFALTLIAGVMAGTYSSIFLASPLLVYIKERYRKKSM